MARPEDLGIGDAAPAGQAGGATLAFMAGGACLSLPVGAIGEIMRLPALTRVPLAPDSLMGVANLRGRVLPVVSVARLLGRPASDAPPVSGLVVDGAGGFGLFVDAVHGLGRAEARPLDLEALLAPAFGAAQPARGSGREEVGREPVARDTGGEPRAADPGVVSLVCFSAAGQDYALPLESVAEVIKLPEGVAAVPESGPEAAGVITWRGGLLPLISLRALLGLARATEGGARVVVTRVGVSCVGVSRGGEAAIGLVVDGLKAILRATPDQIDAVPAVLARSTRQARIGAICRVEGGRRLIGILSPAQLFDDATAARLQAAAAAPRRAEATAAAGPAEAEAFAVFTLGGEHYGLPASCVAEILRHPGRLTPVPRGPDFLAGVMNRRGAILPVLDQASRFGLPAADGAGRIMVVTMPGGLAQVTAGLAVESVPEVARFAAGEIAAAPPLAGGASRLFDRVATRGHDGRVVLLVDPRVLLDGAQRDILADMTARLAAQGPAGAWRAAGFPANPPSGAVAAP